MSTRLGLLFALAVLIAGSFGGLGGALFAGEARQALAVANLNASAVVAASTAGDYCGTLVAGTGPRDASGTPMRCAERFIGCPRKCCSETVGLWTMCLPGFVRGAGDLDWEPMEVGIGRRLAIVTSGWGKPAWRVDGVPTPPPRESALV